MKKFMLFAAAMLTLVACNKNASDVTAPARKVVLHATVDNGGAANGPARIAPVDPTADEVEFAWEENDQIKVVTDAGTYTLTATNINGNQADFEGEIAGSLDDYTVYYGYNPDAASQTVEYKANSFMPCVKATGCSGESFVLDQFYPVLKLQLTGASTLGKIEYLIGTDMKATMTIPGGIALSSTASVVYLPVANVASTGFSLKFYGTDDALIIEKATTFNLADKMGKIVTMTELEVKGAPDPKDVFKNGAVLKMVFQQTFFDYMFTYTNNSGVFVVNEIIRHEWGNEEEDLTDTYGPYFTIDILEENNVFKFDFAGEGTLTYNATAKTYSRTGDTPIMIHFYIDGVDIIAQLTDTTN